MIGIILREQMVSCMIRIYSRGWMELFLRVCMTKSPLQIKEIRKKPPEKLTQMDFIARWAFFLASNDRTTCWAKSASSEA